MKAKVNYQKLGKTLGRGTALSAAVVLVALMPFASATLAMAQASTAQPPASGLATKPEALLRSYPGQLDRIEANDLVWKDGTRMAIDDGRGAKSPAMRLEHPDIKDMLADPYPWGQPAMPPAFEADPGRARPTAFFDKMYGDCRKGEVEKRLIDIVWLPSKWGKRLRVTTVNGVDRRLAAVSQALDSLPASFDLFLRPPAGAYNCRAIAGTERVSTHGYGIAIDLATPQSDYWRWARPAADGRHPFRNRIPTQIVAIFEAHGFIWGGRWYHYDTMHFEYRPELLPPLAPLEAATAK